MMVKNLSIHLLVQIGVLLLIGAFAGFTALTLFGAIGGVAMGVAPEPTFGLVENIVCPDGSNIKYYDAKRSYHEPGESEPHVECIWEDGQSEDVLLKAILIVLGFTFIGVFLVVFIPVFIPVAIIGYFITRKVIKSRK
jgi:hypothetical protein